MKNVFTALLLLLIMTTFSCQTLVAGGNPVPVGERQKTIENNTLTGKNVRHDSLKIEGGLGEVTSEVTSNKQGHVSKVRAPGIVSKNFSSKGDSSHVLEVNYNEIRKAQKKADQEAVKRVYDGGGKGKGFRFVANKPSGKQDNFSIFAGTNTE